MADLTYPAKLFTAPNTGTLTLTTAAAHYFWVGPQSGSAAAPSYRAIIPDDVATGGSVGQLLTIASTGTAGTFGTVSIGANNASNVTSGSAVTLSTATATNIGSITLTAGRWLLFGVVNFVTTGATTLDFKAGSSATSATFGADNTAANSPTIASALSDTVSVNIPTRFIDNRTASPSTVFYLIGSGTFSLGSATAYGRIEAVSVG